MGEAPSNPGSSETDRELASARAEAAALREHLREAARRTEDLKSAILEAALDSVVTIRTDSRIVEWNAAAERTFGHSRADAVGRDIADVIIPPEYREAHHAGMKRYLATGEGPVLRKRIELEAMRADGTRFPIELAISPLPIEGEPHFTAYIRDISDRKRAEAVLRDREQRLRATYESAFAGIGEVDPSGRFLRVNEEFCTITGYPREELETLNLADITHPDDVEEELALFRDQMTGERRVYRLEKRFLHKDGHAVWVDVSASRVDDDDGRPAYGVRVVRDITERRAADQRQSLMIHELNHRVKNTLATVQSIASQSLRTAATPADARAAIEERLLALSRAHDVLTREGWEGAMLSEVVGVAIGPYSGGGRLFEVHGEDVRLLPRSALPLAMALQELATNAVKYGALSTEHGRVRISWVLAEREGRRELSLEWRESGGPKVRPPERKGFGTRLIERGLAAELGGSVSLTYEPTGVVCRLEAPLPS